MLVRVALLSALLGFGPPALPPSDPPDPTVSEPLALTLALSWDAPVLCPAQGTVAEELQALLPEMVLTMEASAPGVGEPAGIARVTIRAVSAQVWVVELELESEFGAEVRSFEAETCAIASEAAVLVIAVTLDPVRVARGLPEPEPEPEPEEPEPGPEPGPEPEPEEPELAAVTEEPSTEARELGAVSVDGPERRSGGGRDGGWGQAAPLGVGLAVMGGGGYGPLDRASGVVMLRGALLGEGWRWEVRGGWLPPVSFDVGDGALARVDGWSLGTRGCGVPGVGAVGFPLCAGVEGGQVRGSGRGSVPNPRRQTQAWVALELGPGVMWSPVERFSLGLEFDLSVPLVRGGFSINGATVASYSPVGARALLALELRLPRSLNHGNQSGR